VDAPGPQLHSDLIQLNQPQMVEHLKTWLKNARQLVSYLPDTVRTFDTMMERLETRPAAQPVASPMVAVQPTAPEPLRIQFFAASPKTLERIQPGRELHLIRERLDRRVNTGRLVLGSVHTGATAKRLQQWLGEDTPTIIHLSCHGGTDHLIFEREDGYAHQMSFKGVLQMLKVAHMGHAHNNEPVARMLIVNACESHVLAERAVNEVPGIDFAIGTKTQIFDESAITFAEEFYNALGEGRGVEMAFMRAQTQLYTLPRKFEVDHDAFELHVRDGIDRMTVLSPR
jgi:hypothetical protein